jgi:hypothetical protein
VPLSCVHGEAAPTAFRDSLNDAISLFVVDKDVNRLGRRARAGRQGRSAWPSREEEPGDRPVATLPGFERSVFRSTVLDSTNRRIEACAADSTADGPTHHRRDGHFHRKLQE